MNEKNVFLNAKWVGCNGECASPIITREFSVSSIKKAVLNITGLGYFEAKINGGAVTEDWFVPVASDYGKRPLEKFFYPIYDEMKHRIYYCTYDITSLLKKGKNILTVQLGNGWYKQNERNAEGPTYYGDKLKTIYSLEIETDDDVKTIVSDGSEKYTDSEIIYNNLFIGEIINPNAVSGEYKNVEIFEDTDSELTKQIGIPDRVIKRVIPKHIATVDGKKIFDAGENISGVVRIYTKAKAGDQIVLRFAEMITDDYYLEFASTGSSYTTNSGKPQIMKDIFVCDGSERYYQPKFVWHAFRYFEVEGDFESAEVLIIHSDTPITACFESSSEGLNFLYNAFIRTQLNNMHGSFPSDCPHRERLGYTGDGQLGAPAAMMMLDCKEFYRKWIQDILDCQDRKSGHVQHTAPFMGGGGGPGGWGCAMILVPYYYYKAYGETEMLRNCYLPMCKWIDYLSSRCENGLIVKEQEGGWCLGDWCTLEEVAIPPEFVNSVYFIKVLGLMCEISKILGENDAPKFKSLSEKTACAVRNSFFDGKDYCGGVQGANAFAVWAGLAGEEMLHKISEKYNQLGHFDTGILGTDILLEVLFENGYADTAYKLLESEEKGSFLFMKRRNATTIWEDWCCYSSNDHPMFGACSRQIYSGIFGIIQKKLTGGYSDITISPKIPQELEFAKGSFNTPYGEIALSFKRHIYGINFKVSVPKGIKAEFVYNEQKIAIDGELSIVL